MSDRRSKEQVWADFVRRTVLSDIQSAATPDPVPMVTDSGADFSMTDEYDTYRLGRGVVTICTCCTSLRTPSTDRST
jgi:hypothetical protein